MVEQDLAHNDISESTHLRNRYGQIIQGVLCDMRRAQEAATRNGEKDSGGTQSSRTTRSLDLQEVRREQEGSSRSRRSAPCILPSSLDQLTVATASDDNSGEDLTPSMHIGVMRGRAKEQDAALKELERQLTALHADMGVGSVHLTELKKPAPVFKRSPPKKKKKSKSTKLGYYPRDGDMRHQ